MSQSIAYVFDPQIGLPLDSRLVVDDANALVYPYSGQMFFDRSLNGFYYVNQLVDGGAGFTIKSIFMSDSNALGNLTVSTLKANEVFLLSDGRLKTEQRSLGNAVRTLNQLEPLVYTKNAPDGTCTEDAGFLAQDLLKTDLAHLVRESDMHVRHQPIVAYLVKAVQELDQRVRTLEYGSRSADPEDGSS